MGGGWLGCRTRCKTHPLRAGPSHKERGSLFGREWLEREWWREWEVLKKIGEGKYSRSKGGGGRRGGRLL